LKKVYIAGKYDDTNVIGILSNIRVGIKMAVYALKQGYLPFCPFLDFMFALVAGGEDLTVTNFKDYSMEWLKVCDEIWLLPSWVNSNGAKKELAQAQELKLKVVYL
jgi:hypothetical protein